MCFGTSTCHLSLVIEGRGEQLVGDGFGGRRMETTTKQMPGRHPQTERGRFKEEAREGSVRRRRSRTSDALEACSHMSGARLSPNTNRGEGGTVTVTSERVASAANVRAEREISGAGDGKVEVASEASREPGAANVTATL